MTLLTSSRARAGNGQKPSCTAMGKQEEDIECGAVPMTSSKTSLSVGSEHVERRVSFEEDGNSPGLLSSPSQLSITSHGDIQRSDIISPPRNRRDLSAPAETHDLDDQDHSPPVAGRGSWLSDLISAKISTESQQTERRPRSESVGSATRAYDLFLSHIQRNAQDAILSMQMFLREERPGTKVFVDVDVEMDEGLEGTLKRAVGTCGAFIFFITDGVLSSRWCQQEIRWAVEFGKNIVLVRETDVRHGGVEMGDFLKQVPEDLLPVFTNCIAIPWHREKEFRKVSIKTILKQANLTDSYADLLGKFSRSKSGLEVTFQRSDKPTTCFEVIAETSGALRLVFFLGGFARFKNKRLQTLYIVVFNVSFWFCGALCAMNLCSQSLPYHIMTTDVLTAYVHVPAWQSWYTWRKFVHSKGCDELLTKVRSNKFLEKRMFQTLRVCGWVVLFLQLFMVTLVLSAFALPGTLHNGPQPLTLFAKLHAYAMWPVIPPLIAALVASYVMFGFIALLHLFDIFAMREKLSECVNILSNFYKSSQNILSGTRDDKLPDAKNFYPEQAASNMLGNIQEAHHQVVFEEQLFNMVADLLLALFQGPQARVNHTCRKVGGLWVHLVLFSTCQVLAVSIAVEAHTRTGALAGMYTWWWGLQDLFHLACGFVLLVAALGIFCIVTTYFQTLPGHALTLMREAGFPQSRQATVLGLLNSFPLGMHIMWETVYIDVPKVAGFFLFLLVGVLGNVLRAGDTIAYAGGR